MCHVRWAKIRIACMLHGWWGEMEYGAETGTRAKEREHMMGLLRAHTPEK